MRIALYTLLVYFVFAVPAFAEWRHLTADKDFEYRFDTAFVAIYPSVFTKIELRPVGKSGFSDLLIPAAVAASTLTATVAVQIDCAVTDAVAFSDFKATLANGKTVPAAERSPDALNMKLLSPSVREILCRQSGPSRPSARWQPIGKFGKRFDERYALIDSESITSGAGSIAVWLRVQPTYPVIFAQTMEALEDFGQAERYHHAVAQVRIWCAGRQMLYEKVKFYDSTDGFISEGDVGGDARPVEPETMAEDVLNFACSLPKK